MADLFAVSLIVALVGGILALAMPCCFSVLLPSYFAYSFKRRIALLRMTLVFGAGISAVLLPIAMGASLLTQYFTSGHSFIFVAGGFLMVFLGLWSLWGHSMLPQIHLPVNLKRTDTPAIFTLGVFSGVASSCCAPVLAGIIVLTALSASYLEAFSVGLSYVFGMVLPLLLVALFFDKSESRASKFLQGRMIHIKLFGMGTDMHSSRLIAGIMFVATGALTVVLGFTNTMPFVPGSQLVSIYEANLQQALTNAFSTQTGATVTSLGVIAILGVVMILAATRKRRTHKADEPLPSKQLTP
ncbi:MAG: hypothetical protein LYZ66_03600 [Nitrososphaerales archaeon]|nr:hypothetical protein [Nitrososphaerales archaeon]